MRWTLILLACCSVLLQACSQAPIETAPEKAPFTSAESRAEFTEVVRRLESSIEVRDESAADAAFTTMIRMLQVQPSLQTTDCRSAQEVLLNTARLGREHSDVPLNSCEICTEQEACGWTEAESLSMLAYLYPEDPRVEEAIDAFVPESPEDWPGKPTDEERAADFRERIKPHVARVLERIRSAESSATL